jgi:glutaminase
VREATSSAIKVSSFQNQHSLQCKTNLSKVLRSYCVLACDFRYGVTDIASLGTYFELDSAAGSTGRTHLQPPEQKNVKAVLVYGGFYSGVRITLMQRMSFF